MYLLFLQNLVEGVLIEISDMLFAAFNLPLERVQVLLELEYQPAARFRFGVELFTLLSNNTLH